MTVSIRDEVNDRLKKAMKSGDRDEVSVLRMLLSELKVAERSGSDYNEMDVVQSYAKRLRKNVQEYEDLELEDQAEEARRELSVVEEFMPEQMDRGEIEELVSELVDDNDYGPRDLGKVMKQVMSEYGDRVEGDLVRQIAEEKLSENE